MKQLFLKIYNFPFLGKEKVEKNQQKIRDVEWKAIKNYIPEQSKFLDVGCGAGYAMVKAANELNCSAIGIDPDPGAHGVGRYSSMNENIIILKSNAEKIPFENDLFDVVYCSHVLEHVKDEQQALAEMKRVMKKDGLLIIGMPTATMAFINLITQIIFTTHSKIVNVLFKKIITTGNTKFKEIFLPTSHGNADKTIYFDIKHYKIKNWQKIIEKQFIILSQITPALYPYPEFRQLFKMTKLKKTGSSVFFICKKT